jgi:hypothetical protein
MGKRERIEPIPQGVTVELDHDHDTHEGPCDDCAERYRLLFMFTAAFAFLSAVLLSVIALGVWEEIR